MAKGKSSMGEGGIPPGIEPDLSGLEASRISMLLTSRQTALSLHRTRMSADRTLMSVVRTSLSLIGFGFTIFQFFRYLRQSVPAAQQISSTAARTFGMALVLFGVAMLVLGIWNHIRFMVHLRAVRRELAEAKLIQAEDTFPISTTLLIAVLLLLAGLVAYFNMLGQATSGP
jgi:putative membrane protein